MMKIFEWSTWITTLLITAVLIGYQCDAQLTTIDLQPATSAVGGNSTASTTYSGSGTFEIHYNDTMVRKCVMSATTGEIISSSPPDDDKDGIVEEDRFISNCDTTGNKLILTIYNLTAADNSVKVEFSSSVGTPVSTNLNVIYCPNATSNDSYTCKNCESGNTYNCESTCSCKDGYTGSDSTITCQNDATWTESDIKCESIPSTTATTTSTTTTEPDVVVVCLWCIILLSVAVAIIVILLILIWRGCLEWKGCNEQ